MQSTDRQIIKDLLQSLTDHCLFGSDEFRAALKHFNITTTYTDQQLTDEAASLLGKEHNHFVDVLYGSRIDAHPHGERFWFATREEAAEFAARERTIGDEPDVQNAIDAAHAEALEMDAEFNFELVSREINVSDLPHMDGYRTRMIDAAHAEALAMDAKHDRASARITFNRTGEGYVVLMVDGQEVGQLIESGTDWQAFIQDRKLRACISYTRAKGEALAHITGLIREGHIA